MTIDFTKPVETMDGHEVRIYDVDGAGPFSIHGAIKSKCGWESFQWTPDGKWSEHNSNADLNLRNKPEEDVRWVPVYDGRFGWECRESAVREANKGCGSAALVKLTYIDGKPVKAELEYV